MFSSSPSSKGVTRAVMAFDSPVKVDHVIVSHGVIWVAVSQGLSRVRVIYVDRTLRPQVVGLGEPMVEFCANETGRLGRVEAFKRGWGGDTSNFAVAAARTGSRAAHMCRLGGDEFGRSFTELWAREGMDTSRVVVAAPVM